MTGIYHSIRGFFDAKYSGRYLALILLELGRRHPVIFARVMGMTENVGKLLKTGKAELKHEWIFSSKSGRQRRADLAVLLGGDAVVVIEIKEDDILSAGNDEQLDDYVTYLAQLSQAPGIKTHFIHLSRYPLPSSTTAALARASARRLRVTDLRYRNLLENLEHHDFPHVEMVRDYLKDIDVASYKSLNIADDRDIKAICFLLVQLIGFRHEHGYGRLQSDHAVSMLPSILEVLLNNLAVLGEWAATRNPAFFSTRFSRKFRARPYLDLPALRNDLSGESLSDEDLLPGADGKYVKSGTVLFYAQGKFRTSLVPGQRWFYQEFGYTFDLPTGDETKKKRNAPFGMKLYAAFSWPNDEAYVETRYLEVFPSEAEAQKLLAKLIKRARATALKRKSQIARKALSRFRD